MDTCSVLSLVGRRAPFLAEKCDCAKHGSVARARCEKAGLPYVRGVKASVRERGEQLLKGVYGGTANALYNGKSRASDRRRR